MGTRCDNRAGMRCGRRSGPVRLGVVGSIVYPDVLDERQGDARTWSGVARYFDDITVIANTAGRRPRLERVGRVRYILLPKLPRAIDVLAFPLAAGLAALALRATGVRVWAASDPLRSALALLPVAALPRTRLVVHV